MKKSILLGFIVIIVCEAIAGNINPLIINASLKQATVYRSGAELIHEATAGLIKGNNVIRIEGLSTQVDVNSIQLSCPSFVTLMGITYTDNYMQVKPPSLKMKMLTDSLLVIQKNINEILISVNTNKELLEVLRANKDIKGQQNGVSVAELMKLMEYYETKSTQLQMESGLKQEKLTMLNKEKNKLNNQLLEEADRNNNKSGAVELQLQAAMQGSAAFKLSYITQNAYWTPTYDIRVDDIKQPLKVIYKANVVQTTGVDWKQIKLSLSTSMPNQWGTAPVLKSWFLSYINPIVAMERSLSSSNTIQSMGSQLQGRVAGMAAADNKVKIRGAQTLVTDEEPLYVVNGVIMNAQDFNRINVDAIKNVEVLKDAAATSVYGSRGANGVVLVSLKEGLDDYISVAESELNVTFDIELPYDIATNGKEQMATLKEYTVPARYKYYAVPKLDKDAYLLGEVPEWEKLNLLPGEANIIFEGTYVGKSVIDPNSTSDMLNLTLGRDKRVAIKKEKLMDYSAVKYVGNNKQQKITYELTVRNNKKDSVQLLLKDQYPLSMNKEVNVEVNDEGGAENNKELGVLTWKLKLAAGETRQLRFTYTVKYPKDKLLNLN